MAWLRRLHAWAGLGLCLLLAAIAFSGAALVFKDDLRRALDPTRAPPPSAEAAAGIMRAAEARLGPEALQTVIFASPAVPRHEATLRNGGVTAFDGEGRVVGRWARNGRVMDAVFDLHHHLLIGEAGIALTGWVGVLAVLMSVSGLVLWWPARRSFRLRVVPAGAARAAWLSAHRDLAVMTAPLILLSMLTGIPNALQPLSRPLLGAPAPSPPKAQTTGPVNWSTALAVAQQRFPEAQLRMAIRPAKAGAPVTVRLRQPHEWHVNGRTIVYLEPATAAVIGVHDDRAQPAGGRFYNTLWPVHAAKVGGLGWKLVILVSGLSLGLLSLYGGEAYRRRLMSPRQRT